MLYDSYEQVVMRDQPAYWYRPTRAGATISSAGRPGTGASITATSAYGGPGLPGTAQGTSTHTVGTSNTAGSQGWISGAHTLSGSAAVGWTLEAWFRPTVAFTASRIYNLFNRYSSFFPKSQGLFVADGSVVAIIDPSLFGVEQSFQSDNVWRIDDWVHCVSIHRTGANQLWVNGSRCTTVRSGNPGAATSNFGTNLYADVVGQSGLPVNTFYSFPGFLAEPAIYEYALSPSQIVDHYRAGLAPRRSPARLSSVMLPTFPQPTPTPGGLTPITTALSNRRVAVVSDRPR